MVERENILAKVKRMLNLAAGATNEHEAAVAASTAHKFLEKHNLCISDVDEISIDASEILEDTVFETGRLANWRRILLSATAQCFNCSTLISSSYRGRALKLVGTKEDMAVAKATYFYLQQTVERLAKRNAKGEGRSYVNSYKRGLVSTISRKLREKAAENRQEIEKVSTVAGTQLAVVKDANLKDYISKFGSYKAPESKIDFDGYSHGRRDGESVGLNAQVTNNSNERIH